MNNDELNFFGCIGIIAGTIALIFASAIMNGWVLATLWAWFILPVFEQASPISLVQAIGIGMVAGFVTSKPKLNQDSSKRGTVEIWVNTFCWAVLSPCMTVFLGWVLFAWFI